MKNIPTIRPLIVAENTSNGFGGEAILPLHYFNFFLAKNVDCYLVTHHRNKARLASQFNDEKMERIFFVEDLKLQQKISSLQDKMPRRVYDLSFGILVQLLTRNKFKALVRRIVIDKEIDIVHQPIPVSPRLPSNIFNVGAPVIIGPLNGGMTFPPGLEQETKLEKYLISIFVKVTGFANFLVPGKSKASRILVANERTKSALPKHCTKNIILYPENGVDLQKIDNQAEKTKIKNNCFTLVFLGRLIEWKAVDLLIQSMKKIDDSHNIKLQIIGNGRILEQLKELVTSLNLDSKIEFFGQLDQADAFKFLDKCDALILPSLYECGGAVVLEAMACSKPVIATNWGGPADYITSDTGILIETGTNKTEFIENIRSSILNLVSNPELATSMGENGRKRVEKYYTWVAKAEYILDLFSEVIEESS